MLVACAGAIVEHGQHREPPDAAHLNCPPGWGPFMAKKKKSTRAQTGATLTDKAYAILRRAIIQGEFEEGAFLSGPDIMKKYRIGRTPFREACNRLHHERILEVVSRRGYLVPEISFRTVREWLEVRELLEGLIAGLAALRATAEQIREFEALGQRSWSARVDEADYLEMVEANTKFHLHLAKMTQNRELMRLAQSILERTERLSYIEVRSSSVRNTEIRALHGPLVRAIRDRDPIAARRAVIADIRNGERALFDRDVKDHDEEIWGASTGTKNRSVLVS